MTKEELQASATLFDEKLKPIHNDITSLKNGQEQLQADVTSLKTDVRKLEVKIENETDRSITIIAEGHGVISRKLDGALGVESRVENVENRVSAVEYALKK